MERKKILVVTGPLELGGTENHLLKVLPRINQEYFEPVLYPLESGGKLEEAMVDADVRVIKHNKQSGIIALILTAIHLCHTLRIEKPNIIHFFLPSAYIVGSFCSLIIPGVHRVVSRRSLNNYQKQYPGIKYLEHLLHRYMDAILGNSQAVVRQLIEEEKVKENCIGLLYNGIEVGAFPDESMRNRSRNKLGVLNDDLIMVIVANLIPYKGHKDLIEALGKIKNRLSKGWHLFCVGQDDGCGGSLREQAQSLGIGTNVSFVGQIMDVSRYTTAADIGLLISHEEGFSNSLLEGMAQGIPMIVTEVGGNAEAVEDGVSGLVIPANAPHAIGEAILRLSSNPDLREQLGIGAYQRVKTKFSIEDCVSRYNRFYTSVTEGNCILDGGEIEL